MHFLLTLGLEESRIIMTNESTISARLALNLIDQETTAALREAKSFILAELPSVLDRFYGHIGKFSEAAIKASEHMVQAKQMHLQHWSVIAEGQFDGGYEASATKVAEAHNKLGLESHWYVGAYSLLATNLVEVIACKMPVRLFDRRVG